MKRIRVTVAGAVVHEVPLDRELLVGRTATADLRVEDGEVSSRHLRIRPDADGATVEDLGSTNGSTLDGDQPLAANAPTAFLRGQKLTVGPATIELIEETAAHSSTFGAGGAEEKTVVVGGADMQAELVNVARFRAAEPRIVIAVDHDRRTVPLQEMAVTIGRDPATCQVAIQHQSVSGRHAALAFQHGRFHVRDLDSSNGTFLDGAPVVGQSPLTEECALTIGTVDCLYVQNPSESEETDRFAEALAMHAVALGRATESQARAVLAEHRSSGRSVGELFVEQGVVAPKEWSGIYAQRHVLGTLGATAARKPGGGGLRTVLIVIAVLAVLYVLGNSLGWFGVE